MSAREPQPADMTTRDNPSSSPDIETLFDAAAVRDRVTELGRRIESEIAEARERGLFDVAPPPAPAEPVEPPILETDIGEATFYGGRFHGRRTASGALVADDDCGGDRLFGEAVTETLHGLDGADLAACKECDAENNRALGAVRACRFRIRRFRFVKDR